MLKFITEFGPLVLFFVGYKTGGMMTATMYMLAASSVAIIITYVFERKIHKINLISTALLAISSSLTLISGNAIFIKMKPTILYMIFALIFLVTNIKKKPAIKFMLGHSIKMTNDDCWMQLNFRFMFFFILMAITNEFMWRNFDEATWVNFKVFGAFPITLLFMISQVPFIMKHSTITTPPSQN